MKDIELEGKLKEYGQEHLLQFWDKLTAEEQLKFQNELKMIDFAKMKRLYDTAVKEMNNDQVCVF